MTATDFNTVLHEFYSKNSRLLPWRTPEDDGSYDPYKITVSEIMLQQTQVDRVIPKYTAFIEKFPDSASLAAASLHEVLHFWAGLGYNRRAKYLHEFAETIAATGVFPSTAKALRTHRGIGPNTAAAILVYTYNRPHVFIETNIKTVYLHHFFNNETEVSDVEITEKVIATLDKKNPREFYWGIMDYGSYLKKNGLGGLTKSKSHKKQSPFKGSIREIRGKVINLVTTKSQITTTELGQIVPDERLGKVLEQLEKEEMITISDSLVTIA